MSLVLFFLVIWENTSRSTATIPVVIFYLGHFFFFEAILFTLFCAAEMLCSLAIPTNWMLKLTWVLTLHPQMMCLDN